MIHVQCVENVINHETDVSMHKTNKLINNLLVI